MQGVESSRGDSGDPVIVEESRRTELRPVKVALSTQLI